jgi:Trypsin-like peptidase domain
MTPLRLITVWLLAMVAALSRGALADAQVPPALLERAKSLVVMIEGNQASFSAGIAFGQLRDRVYIVTAYHVLRAASSQSGSFTVRFRTRPDKTLPATVERYDADLDLAVLSASAMDLRTVLPFGSAAGVESQKAIAQGVPVYTIGYPDGHAWRESLVPDTVYDQNDTWIEFQSAFVTQGHSGGVLLNARGEVVGMIQSRDAIEARAIRIDVLLQRLKAWKYPVALSARPEQPVAESAELPLPIISQTLRSYRHMLSTVSGEFRFVHEVAPTAAGQVFTLEVDSLGRTERVVTTRGGRKTADVIYHFTGESKLPSSFEAFAEDAPVSAVTIERDAWGRRRREERYTMSGALSSYTTYTYNDDIVEVQTYNASGERTARRVKVYDHEILIKEHIYPPDENTHYESKFDPDTGLITGRLKSVSGMVTASIKPLYGPDGQLLREDVFNSVGEPFGHFEFIDGLLIRKYYFFSAGSAGANETRDSVISYDRRRWPVEAIFSVNGHFVCRFVADYDEAGRTRRTIALGSSNELLAEYPDHWINEVTRDGAALDGLRSIVHKPPPWW